MNTLLFWTCLLGLALSITDSRSLQHQDSLPERMDARKAALFRVFEEKFLRMLGLNRRPVVTEHTKVPQYMLDLYNSQVKDENYVTTNLMFKDFSTTANTVRAFYHADMPEHNKGGSHRRKRRFAINIRSVPSHEELVKAEFRLYRSNVSRKLDYPKHIINVYQLLQPGVATESVKRLLDSRIVNDTSSEGWERFDILKAVQDWAAKPAENHGLEVDIMSENGNPIDISHLRFDKPQGHDQGTWTHHRPLLALFTKDPNTHHHEKREKRSTHNMNAKQNKLCSKHDLFVNFTKLGWTWVEGPEVFNAYICKGKCVYPLANHMNATNHAIVQTLIHGVKKFRNTVPPACCIPVSYDSLGILYLKDDQPIFKRYTNMVVTGCGCR